MLTLSVIFLTLDFYYACWIYQLRHKFPQHISEHIYKALYGFGADMISSVEEEPARAPGEYQEKQRIDSGGRDEPEREEQEGGGNTFFTNPSQMAYIFLHIIHIYTHHR